MPALVWVEDINTVSKYAYLSVLHPFRQFLVKKRRNILSKVYICTWDNMCVSVSMCLCRCVCVDVSVYVCVCLCVCVCLDMCVCVHMCIQIQHCHVKVSSNHGEAFRGNVSSTEAPAPAQYDTPNEAFNRLWTRCVLAFFTSINTCPLQVDAKKRIPKQTAPASCTWNGNDPNETRLDQRAVRELLPVRIALICFSYFFLAFFFFNTLRFCYSAPFPQGRSQGLV